METITWRHLLRNCITRMVTTGMFHYILLWIIVARMWRITRALCARLQRSGCEHHLQFYTHPNAPRSAKHVRQKRLSLQLWCCESHVRNVLSVDNVFHISPHEQIRRYEVLTIWRPSDWSIPSKPSIRISSIQITAKLTFIVIYL
jgi:hypothetical protein